ncbi:flagellar hook-length control protein FliK [Pseudomonas sp. CR3202]|uniref:flagellar hook-length control protein FliK n=1 Tax=Pseudomonas sp. CR3202 TaxID=3351532 RepID=UPI003BF15666
MPVAPDLLLQARPEVKPKAPAAKAPEKPVETSKDEAASFARMYAKERQATAVERRDESGAEDGAAAPDPAATDPAACQQPTVADSGNSLPTEEDDAPTLQAEPVLDPLLLMAMAGVLPADAAPVDAQSSAWSMPSSVSPADGASPAQTGEAGLDAVADILPASSTGSGPGPEEDLAPGKLTLAPGTQAQPVQAPHATPAIQGEPAAEPDFASALAAFADKPLDAGEGKLDVELPEGELSAGLADSLGESKPEAHSELLASRLNTLSQAINQQVVQAARAPALVPGQPVALQQGGWSEAVVDRVMWLSSQNLKSAEIQLDPQELGRLEVRVQLTQDQTQVTFASPHANVRDALEGQMHRLRELFAQQGMNQLDVNVSDQSLSRGWQGQGGDGERRGSGGRAGFGVGSDEEVSVSLSEVRPASAGGGRGLVDFYA